jgi:hypothetical protein
VLQRSWENIEAPVEDAEGGLEAFGGWAQGLLPVPQFAPWWVLLPCLLAVALYVWLAVEGTRPWWQLAPLVALLSPLVLAGAMVAAVTVAVLLPEVLSGIGDAYQALVALLRPGR